MFRGTSAPHPSTWIGSGAFRIDLTSPDLDFGFLGESLAWLAPDRGQRQPAVRVFHSAWLALS